MEKKEEKKESVDGNGGEVEGVDEAEGGAVRVLVVDDSTVDRKIVERLLDGGRFEVVAVDSGKKAMEALGLDKEKPEDNGVDGVKIGIILTDYCMPEMNGYDLLEAVKGKSNVKWIPIVVMSSENDPQRISRCQASGAEEIIIKPLKATDIEKLRSCVRSPESSMTTPKACKKMKMPLDMIADESGSENRPRLARVTVS